MRATAWVGCLAVSLALAGCASPGPGSRAATSPPSPVSAHVHSSVSSAGHVVIVVMENHSYADIIGSRAAPYLNALARSGANLVAMHAVTHPSQPNYVALFSGSTRGVIDDRCPLRLSGDNLAAQLRQAGRSFAGYSEGLPRTGSHVCRAGAYARKHAPWTNWAGLPATTNRPFSSFPSDYARLPTVSVVIPDLDHDMHDGSVAAGDAWARRHLDGYARWARAHHSLLVVAWDEDDRSAGNRIPTLVVGAGITPQRITRTTTLYSVLRLVEDRYGLPRLGGARTAPIILR